MKRVLFLSYYFPPRNRISSYRVAGFCRHLPGFDWEPVVICEDWPTHAPDYDEQLLSGLEGVETHRIQSYGPRGFNRFLIRNVYPWVSPHKTPYNWWKIARQRAIELCESRSFDAIIATYDPLPTLSIAAEVSSRFGIPWIADIRDSWNAQKLSSYTKQKMIAYHERNLTRRANEVTSVSNGISNVLGEILDRKVHTITNGFDPFEGKPDGNPQENHFDILYAGNLSLNRDPTPLFEALQKCHREGLVPEGMIRVCFLGSSRKFADLFDLERFRSVSFSFEPRVSRLRSQSKMRAATILLLLTHPGELGVVTGKVFDYLSSGRPILAIPDDKGEIKHLLGQTKAGVCLSSPDEIAEKIIQWFRKWGECKDLQLSYDKEEVLNYSRAKKTEQLVQVLNGIS